MRASRAARGFLPRASTTGSTPCRSWLRRHRRPATTNDSKTEESPQFTAGEAPDGLARLTTPAGLAECLRAVARSYPGVAVVLDYARFDGQPALMIVIQQVGSSKIIVVGPNCGVSGTDEKAAVSAG